ncbi:type I-E CRISPR-associated protein Cas6/Cse3/CasE [Aurantimonas sp. Leaf443]|uniref:type I-E CRISPR-associated protein Cas6/Cse3/CasE n=1 Tax=Aurantimonas sp. Leaf443 TaxID=1736378 RepID=UPI0006F66ED2|nr:type I-E CRISPR-associated protein Cas6/Cse3/CasE [Aurantimonas sp. Leaf443]KQT88477.1 hypothetical protein ASG48_03450 [Aurantimonas sp. Leaf443]
MTLHLLRLDPDPHQAARWFAAERLDPRRGEDDGYGWHALLCAAFGKEGAPRPFRLLSRRGRPPQLLAYSAAPPAALEETARAFADPLALAALGLAEAPLAAKAMPQFAQGRRLGFTVRLRPTVRTDREGERNRSAEIDAYVAALRAAEREAAEPPARAAVYAAWARGKLEAGGARVLDLSLDGLDRTKVARRGKNRQLVGVDGHAAEAKGVIEVAEAGLFAQCLARGLGRHRAFGYGMLLLSPA